MLSAFGKEVRKLRIDHQPPLRLKDLAERIYVSSAYLSAIETGAKAASPSIIEKIADVLKVDPDKRRELHRLGSESTKVVQLDLNGQGTQARELATAFARRFPSFDEEQVEELLRIIERDEQVIRKKGRAR